MQTICITTYIYGNEWTFVLGNSFWILEDIYLFTLKFNFPIHDCNIEHQHKSTQTFISHSITKFKSFFLFDPIILGSLNVFCQFASWPTLYDIPVIHCKIIFHIIHQKYFLGESKISILRLIYRNVWKAVILGNKLPKVHSCLCFH